MKVLRFLMPFCLALYAPMALACFVPIRPVEGSALQTFEDCAFRNAGGADKNLEWMGQSAYRLSNGLVAQSVRGLGYCNETFFVGTMIVDCDARRATILFNSAADDLWYNDTGERPGLPIYLGPDQSQNFHAIVSHPRVTEHDLAAVWAEPETGQHPDLFCGCAVLSEPEEQKG